MQKETNICFQYNAYSHHFQDHHHLPHKQLIIIINTIIYALLGEMVRV